MLSTQLLPSHLADFAHPGTSRRLQGVLSHAMPNAVQSKALTKV